MEFSQVTALIRNSGFLNLFKVCNLLEITHMNFFHDHTCGHFKYQMKLGHNLEEVLLFRGGIGCFIF